MKTVRIDEQIFEDMIDDYLKSIYGREVNWAADLDEFELELQCDADGEDIDAETEEYFGGFVVPEPMTYSTPYYNVTVTFMEW